MSSEMQIGLHFCSVAEYWSKRTKLDPMRHRIAQGFMCHISFVESPGKQVTAVRHRKIVFFYRT